MRDERIVALLRKKSERGLHALAEKYGRLLHYVASGILRNRPEDVEECLNDVYLHIWAHAETFDFEKASLPTYLKVLTRNASINRLKWLKRRESRDEETEEWESIETYVDERQNVERAVLGREDVRRLEEMIAEMEETDREILLRRYFYLQSSREISQYTGMSVSAIDSRLSRLRARIRKEFKE